MSVKSNYAPVKSKISTSPSSSFVLSAETQRFAVTDSHPYAFSFSPTPSEYGSNFKSMECRGFEPLTPTLPALCATNCAKSRFAGAKIHQKSETRAFFTRKLLKNL